MGDDADLVLMACVPPQTHSYKHYNFMSKDKLQFVRECAEISESHDRPPFSLLSFLYTLMQLSWEMMQTWCSWPV